MMNNNYLPINSIAIDETSTRKVEQTYAYGEHFGERNGVLISIINPLASSYFKNGSYFHLFDRSRRFIPFFNKKADNFSNTEWAISIFLTLDDNHKIKTEFRVDNIKCSKRIDFRQAENIFLDIKLKDENIDEREWRYLRKTLLKLHEYATILKHERLGHSLENLMLNGGNENLNVWPIVHEFSLCANQKFGEYVFSSMHDLKFIPLVLTSTFTEEKKEILNKFLEAKSIFNKYSRFGAEKIHFAKTNKLISDGKCNFSKSENDIIYIYENAYEYIINIAKNIINADSQRKQHLVKAWFEELKILALKEELYPEIVYKSKIFVDTIQPVYGNYDFYERKNLNETNNFFFHENLKYYTYVTTPCRSKINFYLVNLIFLHIRKTTKNEEYKQLVRFMQDEDIRKQLIGEITETKDKDKAIKKFERTSRVFIKPIMQHSLIAKHSIQNENLIVELSFPLSLNFYRIPINNKINFCETFGHYKNYKQNEESVSFEIDIFVSNNQSSDENVKTLKITSESWKKKLTLNEFHKIRGQPNNNLDMSLIKNISERNQSETPDVFTLNTHVILSVDFIFKNAVLLPVQYDSKEIEEYIPSFAKLQNFDEITYQNDSRPKAKLLKFTKSFIFCMCHNNENQNHSWIVQGVELCEEMESGGNVRLRGSIKANKFTEKFWFSDTKLAYDRICLRALNQIDKSANLEHDNLLVIDKHFYTVFHARLFEILTLTPVYSGKIDILMELNDKTESQNFEDWKKAYQQPLIFDMELYSKKN